MANITNDEAIQEMKKRFVNIANCKYYDTKVLVLFNSNKNLLMFLPMRLGFLPFFEYFLVFLADKISRNTNNHEKVSLFSIYCTNPFLFLQKRDGKSILGY